MVNGLLGHAAASWMCETQEDLQKRQNIQLGKYDLYKQLFHYLTQDVFCLRTYYKTNILSFGKIETELLSCFRAILFHQAVEYLLNLCTGMGPGTDIFSPISEDL